MPYCPECGAQVEADDRFCTECATELDGGKGIDASAVAGIGGDTGTGDRGGGAGVADTGGNWREQYSTTVWVVAVVVGLLTFPIGLVIPAYFYIKASGGTVDQSSLEVWTVILLGILGIAAVEIGGRRGAKILWYVVVALVVLTVLGVAAAV